MPDAKTEFSGIGEFQLVVSTLIRILVLTCERVEIRALGQLMRIRPNAGLRVRNTAETRYRTCDQYFFIILFSRSITGYGKRHFHRGRFTHAPHR